MLTLKQKDQISSSLSTVQKILDSGSLIKTNEEQRRSLIELLITMKDLLIKSDKLLSQRVNFVDDVDIDTNLKINDVTDLISYFRNCACHPETNKVDFNNTTLKFNTYIGQGSIMINGIILGNKYNDDVAFNMGKHNLYLNRHIVRAFDELKNNFSQVL